MQRSTCHIVTMNGSSPWWILVAEIPMTRLGSYSMREVRTEMSLSSFTFSGSPVLLTYAPCACATVVLSQEERKFYPITFILPVTCQYLEGCLLCSSCSCSHSFSCQDAFYMQSDLAFFDYLVIVLLKYLSKIQSGYVVTVLYTHTTAKNSI